MLQHPMPERVHRPDPQPDRLLLQSRVRLAGIHARLRRAPATRLRTLSADTLASVSLDLLPDKSRCPAVVNADRYAVVPAL